MVSAENVTEQTEGIAAVVRSQIFDLTLDKARELINHGLEHVVVELVQDAKVLHSIVLIAPLLISRVVGHC